MYTGTDAHRAVHSVWHAQVSTEQQVRATRVVPAVSQRCRRQHENMLRRQQSCRHAEASCHGHVATASEAAASEVVVALAANLATTPAIGRRAAAIVQRRRRQFSAAAGA